MLHEIPNVVVQTTAYFSRRHLRLKAGEWSSCRQRERWTLDYCGWEGMRCVVGRNGAISGPAVRAPNTWHLYAPDVPYHECYDDPALCQEDMWVLFTVRGSWWPLQGRSFAVVSDPRGRLAEYVRAMYAQQQLGMPGSAVVIHGLFIALLGEIAVAARRGAAGTAADAWRVAGPEQGDAGDGRLLDRVDRLVCERLASPPSLDALAEALHMSVSSLAHRFKAETGLTVVQRIRWLRIREARRLLADPGTTAKRVAYALGFRSAAYFTRVFFEVSGITPMTYLRRAGR
ncbi:MAG: helix-turn-helix transcriptional regulator [Kiritimatiellae bacterium]|nr:helix-turn-helix transcriptional regulator [Kiritimatiellia bacterium]